MAMRTYPSPSGPKNDPGATTMPSSRSSIAHCSDGRPPGTDDPQIHPRHAPGDVDALRPEELQEDRALGGVSRALLGDVLLVHPGGDGGTLDELLRGHARPTGGAP